ncbi:Uncharacterised protein [Mycobacteroides abscessus subsp. abscessus]|nr:Uncharacterised protein [Mycobacteroides abscessus subsp. abscessus]
MPCKSLAALYPQCPGAVSRCSMGRRVSTSGSGSQRSSASSAGSTWAASSRFLL